MNKQTIDKDVKVFLNKGYKEKLDKVYRKFPVTRCEGCGICCTDSPVITYPELLYVIDYLRSLGLNEQQKKQIIKNAMLEHFYGLIDPTVPCPFFGEDHRCLIHKVAPMACKRWGLQSKEENDQDWEIDYEINKEVKEYYANIGIDLADEVIDRRTPYCDKVTILKNPYNFVSRDFDEEMRKVESMVSFFGYKTKENFTLCTYITYITLGERAFDERIKLMHEYFGGNKRAIEDFVESIEFENFI